MKILALIPLAYIIAWFYFLFTWFIPMWSIPLNNFSAGGGQLTIWGIVASFLFFIPICFPILIIAFIFFFVALFD